MRNRQFVFAPKIEYKLVAERSEANLSNLQFPTWCLYCTKLEPIFKTNDVARSARVPPSGFEKADSFCFGAVFLN